MCVCGDDEVDVAVDPHEPHPGRGRGVAELPGACSTRATPARSATSWPPGSEAAVEKRLRSFADAGVTDLSVRVVPIGDDRDALLASMRRTREYLASLSGSL